MEFLKGMVLSKLFGRKMLYGGLLFSLGSMFLKNRHSKSSRSGLGL